VRVGVGNWRADTGVILAQMTAARRKVLAFGRQCGKLDRACYGELPDMDDIKFAAHDETASARPPRYYGVHHLALNTDDMKMPSTSMSACSACGSCMR